LAAAMFVGDRTMASASLAGVAAVDAPVPVPSVKLLQDWFTN